MEDLLEEIVGEIRDEYDKDETDAIIELKPGREYLIDGSTNLIDVNDALKINLTSEEYDSIGGYIIEKLDRLPKSGETLLLEEGIKLTTEVVKRNRVEKVHLFLP
jgi:CBS domain containing-hemolysin-like protein